MEDKQGVCAFISAFELFFFLILSSWKYPAEALRGVLPGSQDVNVNFLAVAKETLSLTEGSVSSPMVTTLSVKGAFLFPAVSPCNQTLRNISAWRDRETPTSGDCIDFHCLFSTL